MIVIARHPLELVLRSAAMVDLDLAVVVHLQLVVVVVVQEAAVPQVTLMRNLEVPVAPEFPATSPVRQSSIQAVEVAV